MTIDVLPFSAFALESCAPPAAAPGDGQTLTLSLRLDRAAPAPMTGRLSLRVLHAFAPGTEHAGIACAPQPPLTITFPNSFGQ